MLIKLSRFFRGLLFNGFGKAGVILVTSAFVSFLFLEFLSLIGIFTNAYLGLITYLLLPLIFIIGLILIPIGWAKLKRDTGNTTAQLLSVNFDTFDIKPAFAGSNIFVILTALTLLNVIFLVGASIRTMHFMDSSYFCGNACHAVMHPEWETYQTSPHARVSCVECHVGEGVGALIDSKLNGVWQMVSASLDLYERPIPTPVHRLRPARETCENCHWPDQFYGNKIKRYAKYEADSANTVFYTTLALKVDNSASTGSGIHWHVSEDHQVSYASVNDEREEISEVQVQFPDGSSKTYYNSGISQADILESDRRKMDCVDCHNRATHIYEDPQAAINRYLSTQLISEELPYIKREALSAITANYPDKETALSGIETRLGGFYARLESRVSLNDLDQAISACQEIYNRNIHPKMSVGWNPYPNHIGHKNDGGCFRCHNKYMQAEDNSSIPYDCTVCHSILAWDSPTPFAFLEDPDSTGADVSMHKYLRGEFLKK